MTIPFHPLAEHFPLLEGDEFTDLVASIKSVGQLEPITLYEGMILDGRNRYRACLKAAIEPRSHEYDGTDPIGFVLSKNLHRRHLTIPERAMAVAEYATLKNGHRNLGAGSQVEHILTIAEAAKLARVSDRTIKDAKVVLANGTPAEIASVREGKSGIKPTAKQIRARGTKSGYRIPIPAGFSCLSDAVRAGVERERAGSREEALKQSGLKPQTYLAARDIVLLLERDDLSGKDMLIVQRALSEFDDTRSVKRAAKLVRPIAEKVWGRKGNRFKTDKSRLEAFCNSISFVLTACSAASQMEIPTADKKRRGEVLMELEEAIAALHTLQQRVKKGG